MKRWNPDNRAFAKTTENLKVGMKVTFMKGNVEVRATITSIFDRYCIGTNKGSTWAQRIIEL